MNSDVTSLDRLHDIIVPAPAPWWPLAAGWYWVMAFVIIVLLTALMRGLVRWQHNRYRREALAELSRQEVALKNTELRSQTLLGVSELLKRTALTAFPREYVATLTGPKWFEFLDRTGKGSNFSDTLGPLLEKSVYDPRTAGALDELKLRALIQAVRHWVKRHDPQLEPRTAGDVAIGPANDRPWRPFRSLQKPSV